MFEKIGNAAEKLATNVSESRRGFLVRLGQMALCAAGVMGGLLVLPGKASAGILTCFYLCPDGSRHHIRASRCPRQQVFGGMTCNFFKADD
jgi:hypothetical protein